MADQTQAATAGAAQTSDAPSLLDQVIQATRPQDVKKTELFKDLEKAVEFDQSGLFKKVYEEEYGQLGGTPYGMLIGDYEFGRGAEDVQLLKQVSQVAATAHAPFISNASA